MNVDKKGFDALWAGRGARGVAALGGLLLACQGASAQFGSGFEAPTYAGDPNGIVLNGQDFFYQPVPGSDSFLVFTYAGNALGLPANPTGGDQFVGATGPGGGVFARSQRDIPYGDGTGVWTASFDVAITYLGQLPAVQNIGSFSSQLFPDEATFIALSRWTDPATAANWNADYVWFDNLGNQLIEEVPDPGFQGLQTNHWYRWSTSFDLDSNLITQVSITDLDSGDTATHNPVGRYLWGGAGGAPPPTGFRFFAGGSDGGGNTLGFDNLVVIPGPGALALLALGGLIARRRRR
ncbi:MAG: hypothetical protein ACYS0G_15360 [Planctomycetota bacterium]|jgi:hypothetical protein